MYQSLSSDGYDGYDGYNNNCELSDRDFRDLDIYRDFDEDRDWDVIERTRYSDECRGSSGFVVNDNDVIVVDRLSCYRYYNNNLKFQGSTKTKQANCS